MNRPETFQGMIYEDGYASSHVLLMNSESGALTLPESNIDPRLHLTRFLGDITTQAGLEIELLTDELEGSFVEDYPAAAAAHGILLPRQRALHFVTSRAVEGMPPENDHPIIRWIDISNPLPQDGIDPFSLVSLNRFQMFWALGNAS